MLDRADARRIACAIADSLYPPEDGPAEFFKYARSIRERFAAEVEEALVNGTEDRCVVAYRNGAPVTLAEFLRSPPEGGGSDYDLRSPSERSRCCVDRKRRRGEGAQPLRGGATG